MTFSTEQKSKLYNDLKQSGRDLNDFAQLRATALATFLREGVTVELGEEERIDGNQQYRVSFNVMNLPLPEIISQALNESGFKSANDSYTDSFTRFVRSESTAIEDIKDGIEYSIMQSFNKICDDFVTYALEQQETERLQAEKSGVIDGINFLGEEDFSDDELVAEEEINFVNLGIPPLTTKLTVHQFLSINDGSLRFGGEISQLPALLEYLSSLGASDIPEQTVGKGKSKVTIPAFKIDDIYNPDLGIDFETLLDQIKDQLLDRGMISNESDNIEDDVLFHLNSYLSSHMSVEDRHSFVSEEEIEEGEDLFGFYQDVRPVFVIDVENDEIKFQYTERFELSEHEQKNVVEFLASLGANDEPERVEGKGKRAVTIPAFKYNEIISESISWATLYDQIKDKIVLSGEDLSDEEIAQQAVEFLNDSFVGYHLDHPVDQLSHDFVEQGFVMSEDRSIISFYSSKKDVSDMQAALKRKGINVAIENAGRDVYFVNVNVADIRNAVNINADASLLANDVARILIGFNQERAEIARGAVNKLARNVREVANQIRREKAENELGVRKAALEFPSLYLVAGFRIDEENGTLSFGGGANDEVTRNERKTKFIEVLKLLGVHNTEDKKTRGVIVPGFNLESVITSKGADLETIISQIDEAGLLPVKASNGADFDSKNKDHVLEFLNRELSKKLGVAQPVETAVSRNVNAANCGFRIKTYDENSRRYDITFNPQGEIYADISPEHIQARLLTLAVQRKLGNKSLDGSGEIAKFTTSITFTDTEIRDLTSMSPENVKRYVEEAIMQKLGIKSQDIEVERKAINEQLAILQNVKSSFAQAKTNRRASTGLSSLISGTPSKSQLDSVADAIERAANSSTGITAPGQLKKIIGDIHGLVTKDNGKYIAKYNDALAAITAINHPSADLAEFKDQCFQDILAAANGKRVIGTDEYLYLTNQYNACTSLVLVNRLVGIAVDGDIVGADVALALINNLWVRDKVGLQGVAENAVQAIINKMVLSNTRSVEDLIQISASYRSINPEAAIDRIADIVCINDNIKMADLAIDTITEISEASSNEGIDVSEALGAAYNKIVARLHETKSRTSIQLVDLIVVRKVSDDLVSAIINDLERDFANPYDAIDQMARIAKAYSNDGLEEDSREASEAVTSAIVEVSKSILTQARESGVTSQQYRGYNAEIIGVLKTIGATAYAEELKADRGNKYGSGSGIRPSFERTNSSNSIASSETSSQPRTASMLSRMLGRKEAVQLSKEEYEAGKIAEVTKGIFTDIKKYDRDIQSVGELETESAIAVRSKAQRELEVLKQRIENLVSRLQDQDVAAEVNEALINGLKNVQVPATKNGAEALLSMVKTIRSSSIDAKLSLGFVECLASLSEKCYSNTRAFSLIQDKKKLLVNEVLQAGIVQILASNVNRISVLDGEFRNVCLDLIVNICETRSDDTHRVQILDLAIESLDSEADKAILETKKAAFKEQFAQSSASKSTPKKAAFSLSNATNSVYQGPTIVVTRQSVDLSEYYNLLGLPTTATASEIKKAYQKLCRSGAHPDKCGYAVETEEYIKVTANFQKITDAYNALGSGSEEGKLEAEASLRLPDSLRRLDNQTQAWVSLLGDQPRLFTQNFLTESQMRSLKINRIKDVDILVSGANVAIRLLAEGEFGRDTYITIKEPQQIAKIQGSLVEAMDQQISQIIGIREQVFTDADALKNYVKNCEHDRLTTIERIKNNMAQVEQLLTSARYGNILQQRIWSKPFENSSTASSLAALDDADINDMVRHVVERRHQIESEAKSSMDHIVQMFRSKMSREKIQEHFSTLPEEQQAIVLFAMQNSSETKGLSEALTISSLGRGVSDSSSAFVEEETAFKPTVYPVNESLRYQRKSDRSAEERESGSMMRSELREQIRPQVTPVKYSNNKKTPISKTSDSRSFVRRDDAREIPLSEMSQQYGGNDIGSSMVDRFASSTRSTTIRRLDSELINLIRSELKDPDTEYDGLTINILVDLKADSSRDASMLKLAIKRNPDAFDKMLENADIDKSALEVQALVGNSSMKK